MALLSAGNNNLPSSMFGRSQPFANQPGGAFCRAAQALQVTERKTDEKKAEYQ